MLCRQENATNPLEKSGGFSFYRGAITCYTTVMKLYRVLWYEPNIYGDDQLLKSELVWAGSRAIIRKQSQAVNMLAYTKAQLVYDDLNFVVQLV